MSNRENFVRVEGYDEQFLQSKELKIRQCVYISRDTQEIIANIVRRLGTSGLSIGAYVDTIIRQHLREHKDEINELYSKSSDKIIE
jgi:hypothetical protein